jgi:hypothetical protein
VIFERGAPVGISPVIVALVIDVGFVKTKSSAVSTSNLPADIGRLAAAIKPSGLPVLKVKEAPFAGMTATRLLRQIAEISKRDFMAALL